MRISNVEIKNYRSIENIDFKVLDPSITCFIGGNGSGKSNILKAIASLKKEGRFSEEDFFIEAKDDDQIRVSISFMLEPSDAELLEYRGLKKSDLKGFIITKAQSIDGEPMLTGSLIGYSGAFERELGESIKRIAKLITVHTSPDEEDQHSELVATVLDENAAKDSRSESLTKLFTILKTHIPDPSTEDIDVKLVTAYLGFDESAFAIDNLFSELSIELLSLDEYTLEDEAPIDELKQREALAEKKAHPFLYDLLSISGKTAADFEKADGNRRVNTSEQASNELTFVMQKVWESRGLPLVVQKDKKDKYLSFCTRTPHQKAIPLSSTSDGTQWFLRFYTRLITARSETKRIIWLFDEPDRGLHAKSQQDLIKFIEEQSKESQIMYCTHQPIMIQWHRLERINVVEDLPKEKQKKFGRGTKIHQRFWDDGEFDSPLKEVLKLFIGEDVLWTKEHVVIEGPSDYFYFVGWANYFQYESPDTQIWGDSFASPNRAFVPAGSVHNIPLFLYFLTKRNGARQVNWSSVTDTGSEHEEIQKVVKSVDRLRRFSDRIIPLERVVGDPLKEIDVEDLFDRQEFYDKASDYYLTRYPECKFPSFKDIPKSMRITKALDSAINKLNPDLGVSFDKPGTAQFIYYQLVVERQSFSDASKKNFRATLHAINKTFNIEAKD